MIQDEAFDKLVQEIRIDVSKYWTSVELHTKYMQMNGCMSSRRALVDKIKEMLGDKFYHHLVLLIL